MKMDTSCNILCKKSYDRRALKKFRKKIRDEYFVRLNLDNMPLVSLYKTTLGEETTKMGYPLGHVRENGGDEFCIYNHLILKIKVHVPKSGVTDLNRRGDVPERYRIVGFEVLPVSVKHKMKDDKKLATCPIEQGTEELCFKKSDKNLDVVYSYDVQYEDSPVEWATRWDHLLNTPPQHREIQWFSIINSLMITLFLTAMVAMIMLRTVWLDFARYNNIDDEEEIQEESGWKLIHGDVFRPPAAKGLLCIFTGSGAQLLCMTTITLLFALLGFLSPANRGGLLTAMLTLWVLASGVCGYVSARQYSGLGGTNKKSVTLGSAFLFSGSTFAVFFLLNLTLWISGSTGAVPFTTLLFLLVLWFGISVPLNVVGAFIGYKRKPFDFPTRTNQIPREIPKTSKIPPRVFAVFAGILPFGVVFIELVFILNSLWQNMVFYMFGFLFLVFLILAVTCAEVSIVVTYLTLCKEDYHWWWRSFITAGSSGLYMFGYSLLFVGMEKDLDDVSWLTISSLMYVCYMAVFSFAFMLMTGTIGYMSAATFVKKIYASVRID